MKFSVRKSTNSQFYWRIVASNGQVLATSETYTAKQSAISACESVKASASSAPIVDET